MVAKLAKYFLRGGGDWEKIIVFMKTDIEVSCARLQFPVLFSKILVASNT